MAHAELPVVQRTIRHQFHQLRLDLDQWMELSAPFWRTLRAPPPW